MTGKTRKETWNHWRYLGYDKATLAQYEHRIAQDNLKIFVGALAITAVITIAEFAMIVAFALSGKGVTDDLLQTAKLMILTSVMIVALFFAYLAVRNRPNQALYSRALTTVFLSLWSILYVIISTAINSEDYAVMACGLFLIVQVLFDAYPLENLIFVSCVYGLFAVTDFISKPTMIFLYDLLDSVPFLLIGLFLSWIKSRSKWSSLINADAMVRLETERLENELTRARVNIMLSQIQPHFLYNALSSIQCLCREDPAAAEQATADFSEFLRRNMDSLVMDKPIGFALELEHTQHYLALERLRFPDKLRVEYDIQITQFRIPTLTLQPMVENAVRYGVTKCKAGGTVKISTCETETAFVVTVQDNGTGFDPMETQEDGRTHIGIQNVRERLFRMSGGTLEICSTRGVGTTAVITVPKGGTT